MGLPRFCPSWRLRDVVRGIEAPFYPDADGEDMMSGCLADTEVDTVPVCSGGEKAGTAGRTRPPYSQWIYA
jgi:hypothetical protein